MCFSKRTDECLHCIDTSALMHIYLHQRSWSLTRWISGVLFYCFLGYIGKLTALMHQWIFTEQCAWSVTGILDYKLWPQIELCLDLLLSTKKMARKDISMQTNYRENTIWGLYDNSSIALDVKLHTLPNPSFVEVFPCFWFTDVTFCTLTHFIL